MFLSKSLFNSHVIRAAIVRSAQMTSSHVTYDVIKPQEDDRRYKAFLLNNGLKLLLISDPKTDKSATSLDVNVGSMSDPRHVQGLAHFLEHMLFLGTKTFPEENSYSQYISRNGGSSNAFTSSCHTNFYFDVANDGLSGALDRFVHSLDDRNSSLDLRFSRFFTEPLLTESATEREIEAVNSEHVRNIDDDGWRLSQLEKTLSDPNHDFNKFGTGNLETLRDGLKREGTDLRQHLLDFHTNWYSANLMALVVLAKEPLDQMEELVVPLFSDIRSSQVTRPQWKTHPFCEEWQRKEIKIVPLRDSRSLQITFPIPDLVPHYKSQPGHYIAHLIGHEGAGSLLSELKRRNLCSLLNAYDRRGGNGFGFFDISVDLTEEGIEKTDEIVSLVFQYIKLLKTEGPKPWIHEEEKKIKEIKFRFKDKERPINYVRDLSSVLHDFPLNECLSAGYLLHEFRPDLIGHVLEHMTPDHVRVAIVAKKFEKVTDSIEKWYGTRYRLDPIPEDKLSAWRECDHNTIFHLPKENPFIPENLEIKSVKEEVIKSSEECLKPELLKKSVDSRVWYLKDNEYLRPKMFCAFLLTSPVVSWSPVHASATHLFVRLFRDSIQEELYSAELVGLFFGLQSASNGIILEIGGYNDKMELLLKAILAKIDNFSVDFQRFQAIKDIFVRNLKNYPTRPLHELLRYYTSLITSHHFFSFEELLISAEEVDPQTIIRIVKEIFSRFHLEVLIHGNALRSEALQMVSLFEDQFRTGSRSLSVSEANCRNREIQLPEGRELVFETVNDVHQTFALQIYLQTGVQSTASNAILELMNQLISEPFYHKLRTQEQLGYLTFSTIRRSNGVQGITFTIQSDYSPKYLNQRIEAFLLSFEDYIKEMSDEDFESEKQSLIVLKLEKPKQLIGFSRKLWSEIESKEYNFSRDQIEADRVRSLTRDDVIEFLRTNLVSEVRRKKLLIRILSSKNKNPKQSESNELNSKKEERIESISQLKDRSPLYPLPEPFFDVYERN